MNSVISNLRLHYSSLPNILVFKTPNVSGFLVFGVSNSKYLAFDTLYGNTLMMIKIITFEYVMSFTNLNNQIVLYIYITLASIP